MIGSEGRQTSFPTRNIQFVAWEIEFDACLSKESTPQTPFPARQVPSVTRQIQSSARQIEFDAQIIVFDAWKAVSLCLKFRPLNGPFPYGPMPIEHPDICICKP